MPPLKDHPAFICEACTVRSLAQREIRPDPVDHSLMCLERMRMVDVVNSLAVGTHKQYQGKINYMRGFEHQKNLRGQVLPTTHVEAPPAHSSIPLMWAQQQYSLKVSSWRKRTDTTEAEARVTFATSRALRSAASLHHKLDMQAVNPGKVFMDLSKRIIVGNDVSPTDELGYTMMNAGMSARIGTEANPSIALLDKHIRYLNTSLERRYLEATTDAERIEVARAGLENLLAWLGWLRANELFSIVFQDLEVTLPGDGQRHDLRKEIGIIMIRLSDQTKMDRTRAADIPLPWTTRSGLSPGKWLQRLADLLALDLTQLHGNTSKLFQKANGTKWTSRYFRRTYLWPSLHKQRLKGDPTLRGYDGRPGNSIEEKYWSMHSYRRGGRSQCSKKRPGFGQAATATEVAEQGRWRAKRASEDMLTQYREWTIADRICICLLCM